MENKNKNKKEELEKKEKESALKKFRRYALMGLFAIAVTLLPLKKSDKSTDSSNSKKTETAYKVTSEKKTSVDFELEHRFFQEENGEKTFNPWSFIAPIQVDVNVKKNTSEKVELSYDYELAKKVSDINRKDPDQRSKAESVFFQQASKRFLDAVHYIGFGKTTEKVESYHHGYQKEGKSYSNLKIKKILVVGTSSPELNTKESLIPGNTEKMNSQRGDNRGKDVYNMLGSFLSEEDMKKVELSETEIQFSNAEYTELHILAGKEGFLANGIDNLTGMFEMIKAYNRGEIKNKETLESLHRIIDTKRTVQIIVEYEGQESEKVVIPIPLLLFLIPLIARKDWMKRREANFSEGFLGTENDSSESKAETEAKASAEANAKAETETEAKAKASAESNAKAETETEAEAKASAESNAKAETETEAEAKASAEAKAEAKTKRESETTKKENKTETKERIQKENPDKEYYEDIDKKFYHLYHEAEKIEKIDKEFLNKINRDVFMTRIFSYMNNETRSQGLDYLSIINKMRNILNSIPKYLDINEDQIKAKITEIILKQWQEYDNEALKDYYETTGETKINYKYNTKIIVWAKQAAEHILNLAKTKDNKEMESNLLNIFNKFEELQQEEDLKSMDEYFKSQNKEGNKFDKKEKSNLEDEKRVNYLEKMINRIDKTIESLENELSKAEKNNSKKFLIESLENELISKRQEKKNFEKDLDKLLLNLINGENQKTPDKKETNNVEKTNNEKEVINQKEIKEKKINEIKERISRIDKSLRSLEIELEKNEGPKYLMESLEKEFIFLEQQKRKFQKELNELT